MTLGHLYLDDSRAHEGLRSATLELPDGSRPSVWFRAVRPLATDSGADPFLSATILTWMQAGCDLHVHGSASRQLLAGLSEWQAAWARWRPERYRPVTITVDEAREDRPRTGKAVLAFSGGVDAAYSLQRHVTGEAGWQQVDLDMALLVHGFDIPLDQTEVFERARSRAVTMLAGTDVRLVTVTTNLRDLGFSWEDGFAAAVSAALSLLAPDFGVGLIGSSKPYERLVLPWGSNPATDHLLSSGLMEIRHDGASASRTDKVRLLAGWPGADHLRVCWQGEELDRNCGRCEKCVRTRLNFALAGVEHPGCFRGSGEPSGPVRLVGAGQRAEWAALAAEARSSANQPVLRQIEAVQRWNKARNAWINSRVPGVIRRARSALHRLVLSVRQRRQNRRGPARLGQA